jgi:hypothetical protein
MGWDEIDTQKEDSCAAGSERRAQEVKERPDERRYLEGANQKMEVVAQNAGFGGLQGGKSSPEHCADHLIEDAPKKVVQSAGDLVHAEGQKGCAGEGSQALAGNISEVHIRLLLSSALCVYDELALQKSTAAA